MSKWNAEYWKDLGERVLASAIGGVLTMLGLTYGDLLSSTPEAWATVVLIPAGTSLLKGLLANLNSGEASASLVNVDSYGPLTAPVDQGE